MADDNVFSGFAQGAAQGAQMQDSAFNAAGNYALQKVQLDQNQQHLEIQQQYLQDAQKQTQIRMGETLEQKITGIVSEVNPAVRKIKLKNLRGFTKQAGIPYDEGWDTALQDPSFQKDYLSALSFLQKGDAPQNWTNGAKMAIVKAIGEVPATKLFQDAGQNYNEAKIQMAKVDAMSTNQTGPGSKLDRIDQTNHRNVINKITNNKELTARFNQYSNLNNALSNFLQADHTNPQSFEELQQAVRSNLGIKGTSGVGEREASYIKSLGLSSANYKQFITGKPADISKNNALVKHIINLAQMEQSNVAQQFQKRLDAVSAGHEAMYARRPDLAAGLQSAKQAQMAQIAPTNPNPQSQAITGNAPAQGQAPAPQQQAPKFSAVDVAQASKIANAFANEKDPARKAAIAKRAQSVIPTALRQQVGLP